MTTSADQARAKITKLFTNYDRFDQIVNGDAGTDVFTDGGIVPSIAKVLAGFSAADGWSPVVSLTSDGERRVVKITDWVGGTGLVNKPASNVYIGESGIVSDLADAVDLRGPAGGGGADANIVDSFGDGSSVDVAPSVRAVFAGLAGKVPEAALDHGHYMRRDGAWVALDAAIINAKLGYTPVDPATLAADTGAAGVKTKRSFTGAASQSVAAVLAEFMPTAGSVGAVADGTTDCRTALAKFNTANIAFRLTPGLYYIGSNITFTQPVSFDPGARLVIPNGVTVTFNAGINAGRYQIFNLSGTGNAANLWDVNLEWFAGDAHNTTTECRALIQKAFNANAIGGLVTAGAGYWVIDGTTSIDVVASSFEGAGRASTTFFWQGAATNGFAASNNSFSQGYLRGFRFAPQTPGTIPTSGTAVYIHQSERTISDFMIQDAYDALTWDSIVIGSASNFWLSGSKNRGSTTIGAISQITITDFTIESLYDFTTLTSVVGALNAGDAINLKSGATVIGSGTIVASYGGGRYRVYLDCAQKPAAGHTILSTTSGGTATISTYTVGHALGGISMSNSGSNLQEEIIYRDGGVLGGEYGLYASGKGSVGRVGNFGYNEIGTGVDIDTTWSGSLIDGWYGGLINGWFSSTRLQDKPGLKLVNCKRLRGTPHLVNNGGAGIEWDASSSLIEWTSIDCEGNNTRVSSGANGTMGEIRILGAATDWNLIGGRAGFQADNGITPIRAIYIAVAGGDRIRVLGIDVPAGSVYIGATGNEQTWLGVAGVPIRVPLSSLGDAASDFAAGGIGVPIGGHYRNGSFLRVRAGTSASNPEIEADRFSIGAVGGPFYLTYSGSDPVIALAPNSYMMYKVSEAKLYTIISGVVVSSIDSSGNMRLKGSLTQNVTP